MTARVRTEPIGTERLALLPLLAGHAEEMAVVLADPALHTFIGGAPETADELRARFARMAAGSPEPGVSWCNWAIRLRAEGHLVGTVQATVGTGRSEGLSDSRGDGRGDSPGDGLSDTGRAGPGARPDDRRTEGPDSGAGRVAAIAWMVGTPWQGRGIATEAARGMARALEEQGVRTLIAHVHPDNGASAAVAAALGLAPTTHWHDGEIRWVRRLPER